MINLKEILTQKLTNFSDGNGFYGLRTLMNEDHLDAILSAMKESCNQTVDLCVENANATLDFLLEDDGLVVVGVVWGMGLDSILFSMDSIFFSMVI